LTTAHENLLSPIILFFILGFFAGRVKSDLVIPEVISKGLSLYLMISIGFRGGVELSHSGVSGVILGALVLAVCISFLLPAVGYFLLRKTTSLDVPNAAAISAHYGSVSVATFAAATVFLKSKNIFFEPYIIAMMALMETPAVVSGLLLARKKKEGQGGFSNWFSRDGTPTRARGVFFGLEADKPGRRERTRCPRVPTRA
jgi:hypothetical protein